MEMNLEISKTQTAFIKQGIQADIRQDGRSRLDFRQSFLAVNTLLQASGSSRLSVYNGSDVLIGIKVSVESIQDSQEEDQERKDQEDMEIINGDATLGKCLVSVEWSNSSLQTQNAKRHSEKSAELTEFLNRVLNGPQCGMDLKKLCIVPGALRWVLYIDCMILKDGGNLMDTLFNGIRAALHDTKMPGVSIEKSEHVYEYEITDEQETRIPGADRIPISVTLYKVGNHFIVDASSLEESCTEATLTLLYNPEGNICGLRKSSWGGIDSSLLGAMLKQGKTVGKQVYEAQQEALSS